MEVTSCQKKTPIHIIEIAWLPDETIAQFRSDFKIVADCFAKLRKFHEKKEVYHPLPDEIRHVDETMELLSALSGEARGKKIGEETAWVASVRNLMKSMKMTAQQAVEAVAVPMNLRQKVLDQI